MFSERRVIVERMILKTEYATAEIEIISFGARELDDIIRTSDGNLGGGRGDDAGGWTPLNDGSW